MQNKYNLGDLVMYAQCVDTLEVIAINRTTTGYTYDLFSGKKAYSLKDCEEYLVSMLSAACPAVSGLNARLSQGVNVRSVLAGIDKDLTVEIPANITIHPVGWKPKTCTCGSHKTYGENNMFHSSWCDLYEPK